MDKTQKMFQPLEKYQLENDKRGYSFQNLENYLGMKAREKGVPISGKFELTPLCNFNCKMCYVHLDTNQLDGQFVLPVDTWKDLMYQAWKAGMIKATLTGGECLTYPGFDELYLYLHSLGCEVAVLTNGFLLNEKRIQFFKEHMPSDLQITLYGWNDDVYERVTGFHAFSTIADNIKQAVKADLPVYISITPNKYLGEDLLETIRMAKDLCKIVFINNTIMAPRKETGRSEQQDDIELDLYIRACQLCFGMEGQKPSVISEDKLPPCGGPSHEVSEYGLLCGGGRSSFAIDWKGTMTPCTDLDIISAYPLKDGFTTAWSKINQTVNQWPRVPECKGCAYESACNNCAANVLRFAERGKMPTGLCERTKELVRNGVRSIPECE